MIEIRGLFEAHVDGVSLSATDRKRAEARRKLKLAPVSSQNLVRTARDVNLNNVNRLPMLRAVAATR
jgi:hypothetical protein